MYGIKLFHHYKCLKVPTPKDGESTLMLIITEVGVALFNLFNTLKMVVQPLTQTQGQKSVWRNGFLSLN